MSKPSICFIGFFSLPILAQAFDDKRVGGEDVQLTLLAKSLAARGYRASTIVLDYGQPDGAQYFGVTTYKAFAPEDGIPGLRFFHPRWTGLWQALKRADADVYYTSTSGPHLGQIAAFAKAHKRRLVFRIAHDANCDPSKLMLSGWRDRSFYEYGLRRSDVVLAQTAVQQAMLQKHYGLDSVLAIMMVEPAAQNLTREQRDVDVLWVNNLRRFKRPDICIELARQLPSVRMHMVGGPVPGFEDVYAETQSGVATAPNLRYHGPIPYHKVNDLYERARVFVNTSDTEGFPNSYLQAWTRGAPVVAFFDPDGVIARERLGYAVKTLPEMKEAVELLLNDAHAWSTASARCKAYMHREYNEDDVLAPYIAAFAGYADRRVTGAEGRNARTSEGP